MGWRTEECGVERVFWRPRSTNGEKGGREEGGTMYSGRACLKCEEIYKLSPRFKFLLLPPFLNTCLSRHFNK